MKDGVGLVVPWMKSHVPWACLQAQRDTRINTGNAGQGAVQIFQGGGGLAPRAWSHANATAREANCLHPPRACVLATCGETPASEATTITRHTDGRLNAALTRFLSRLSLISIAIFFMCVGGAKID